MITYECREVTKFHRCAYKSQATLRGDIRIALPDFRCTCVRRGEDGRTGNNNGSGKDDAFCE